MKPIFKKVAASILRATLKSIPGGNPVIEGVQTVKGVEKTVITESGEAVTGKVVEPHNLVSMVIQLVIALFVIYLTVTGKIDASKALEWIGVY